MGLSDNMIVKKYCIIVAGGSGRRMKSAIPKQFLLLEGKPMLMHTIERFHSFDSSIEIILVLPAEHHSLWNSLVEEYSFTVSHTVVAGGEERFHSVRAGLALIRGGLTLVRGGQVPVREGQAPVRAGQVPVREGQAPVRGDKVPVKGGLAPVTGGPALVGGDTHDAEHNISVAPDAGLANAERESLVAIHDGVRPLVSHDTIWRCYADAEEFGTAIPFIEPADSVRILEGDESRPLQRNEVRLIQTPQVFRSSLILNAYDCDFDPSFTDDATVAEAAGVQIHLTHGNRENIKITTPEDLAVATTLARMLRQ